MTPWRQRPWIRTNRTAATTAAVVGSVLGAVWAYLMSYAAVAMAAGETAALRAQTPPG
jgi:hypothetical protein